MSAAPECDGRATTPTSEKRLESDTTGTAACACDAPMSRAMAAGSGATAALEATGSDGKAELRAPSLSPHDTALAAATAQTAKVRPCTAHRLGGVVSMRGLSLMRSFRHAA
jgi:hypothetical protein